MEQDPKRGRQGTGNPKRVRVGFREAAQVREAQGTGEGDTGHGKRDGDGDRDRGAVGRVPDRPWREVPAS